MAETSNISSVIKLKCAKCHEGNLFSNKKIYHLKGFFNMPEHCDKCGQDFQIETGFYLGAMYASYGITILINVLVFFTLSFLFDYNLVLFLIVDAFALLITMPYVVKVSRAIWLAVNVKYDASAILKYEQQA
jgi:uncharacterized protein (DUF983 family)